MFPILKQSKRLYHLNSFEHATSSILKPLSYAKDSIQYKILDHTLTNHVPSQGFSEKSIMSSLHDLGYSSSIFSLLSAPNSPSLFNGSPAVLELVKFHLVTKRLALQNELTGNTTLEELFLKRIEMNKLISRHLTQYLSFVSTPSEFMMRFGLNELHQLSDDLIYYSNEKDHNDLAWYSKRLAISTAFVSTELFMARDQSHNFKDTIQFALKRLDNINNMGNMYNNIEEYAWYTLLSSINLFKSQLARG